MVPAKLNQEQINHLNNPITPKKLKQLLKVSQPKRAQEQMGLVQNSILHKQYIILLEYNISSESANSWATYLYNIFLFCKRMFVLIMY